MEKEMLRAAKMFLEKIKKSSNEELLLDEDVVEDLIEEDLPKTKNWVFQIASLSLPVKIIKGFKSSLKCAL